MNASAIHNHFIEPAHRAVNTKRTTVTLSNPNGAVAAGGDSFNCDDILLGHGATYRLKDVIITSFDNKDSTFQPSNQFASKAIIHPEYEPEASEFESPHGTYLEGLRANPGGDGFMKLGDIRGEFAPSSQVDRDPGDNFHGNAAGDPLPTEEIISNHGNRSNWDVICDVGTSIKPTSVADALTNGGIEGYTEVEWTYLKGDVWTNGSATSIRDGITGSGVHGGLANGAVHPDMPMDTHPNDNLLGHPGSAADALTNYRPFSQMNQGDPFTVLDHGVFAPGNVLRSDNRFVIEPVNLMQGLDAGGMNYAEAVGLDSSSVDVVNKVIDNAMPVGDFI